MNHKAKHASAYLTALNRPEYKHAEHMQWVTFVLAHIIIFILMYSYLQ